MDWNQKVLWSEGQFLTPHHFQQWDRYCEHLIGVRASALQPFGHGAMAVTIDEDALLGGELALKSCRALLPDGLAIELPDRDDPPPPRGIQEHFDPQLSTLGVHLAAPNVYPGRATFRREPAADSPGEIPAAAVRYRSAVVPLNDANTGADPRDIEIARKDLRLLFDGESLDDFTTLKIAELTRGATGAFALREEYVPPCLYISAAPYLGSILRRILEMLTSKSGELSGQRRERAQGLVEFTMSEAASFWLLHAVNANLPGFAHMHAHPRVHPERLYLAIARLAGELFTFAGEGHPRDIPAYQHDSLGTVFAGLERILRDLLGTVVPTRCAPIPLRREGEKAIYAGSIQDERLFEGARFYLAVMSGVPEEKVAGELPIKAKISSLGQVERLIIQAMRGLPLAHLANPPAEIPVQPGRSYFEIRQEGDHWKEIRESHSIAIYVPPEFTELRIELMAVKE